MAHRKTIGDVIRETTRAPNEEAAAKAAQIKVTRVGPSFPGGFGPGDAPISETPNYEKLTSGERWVMDFLPGVSDSPVIGAALRSLSKFGESKFGQFVFDTVSYLSMGTERVGGMIAQINDAAKNDPGSLDDIMGNLKATWYASSMAYDVADIEGWEGPGISGLIKSRKSIIALMGTGMGAREALDVTRDKMMEDAGALALRMQLKDGLFQAILDPLNAIGLWLKPLQGLKSKALANLVMKSDEVVKSTYLAEAVLHLDDLLRPISKVDDIALLAKQTGKAVDASGMAIKWHSRMSEVSAFTRKILDDLGITVREVPKKSFPQAGIPTEARAVLGRKRIDVIEGASGDLNKIINHELGHMVADSRGLQKAAGKQLSDAGIQEIGRFSPLKDTGKVNVVRYRADLNKGGQLGLANEFLADALGKFIENPTKFADEFPELAKFFSKNAKLPSGASRATAKAIEEAEEGVRRIERLAEITPMEQVLVRLFGGTPSLNVPTTKFGKIIAKINPLGITPQSRALSLSTKVIDNVAGWTAHLDPVDAAKLVQRAVDGTFDPRIAHMVATVEGQTTRGLLTMMGTKAADLGEAWELSANARRILAVIERATGDSADEVMRLIFQADNAKVVIKAFNEAGGSLDELAAFVAKELGTDVLEMNAEILAKSLAAVSDTGMATKQGFQAILMESVAASAARFTVAKFGITARGFLPKLANAVKSAESLAFLRANPGYLVRNVLNNEFTMVARGVWGSFDTRDAVKFWQRVGFEPSRLRSGISAIGEANLGKAGSKALEEAQSIITEVAQGKSGILDKFAARVKDIKLGPLDMQALSAKAESGASIRAFTRSSKIWWNKYRKPLRVKDFSDDLHNQLIGTMGTKGVRRLEKRLADALNDGEINDVLKLQEITPGYSEVVENANKVLGADLSDIIPDDELEMLTNKIIAGFEEGGKVRANEVAASEFERIGTQLGNKVDESIKNWAESTRLQVEHEGPIGALHQWANSNADLHNGAQAMFAVDQAKMARAIRSGALGPAREAWKRSRARADRFWANTFKVIEARTAAIEQGLKGLARDDYIHVEGIVDVQRTWGKNWKTYFKTKDGRFDSFFATEWTDDVARQKAWGQLQEANQIDYARTIEDQTRLMQDMDDIMVRLVPEVSREAYMSGRTEIRKLTELDQQMVLDFYEKLRGADLDSEVAMAGYNDLMRKRLTGWEQVADMEKALAASLRGNGDAAGFVSARGAAQNNAVAEVRKAWQALVDAGDVVGGEAGARLTELRIARKALLAEAKTAAPALPRGLAGAKPRYAFGKKQFALAFDSDLDKAIYIVTSKKASKSAAKYKAFLKEAGLSPTEIRAAGKEIRAGIKETARQSPAGNIKVSAHSQPGGGENLAQVTKEIDELEAAGLIGIGSIDTWLAELQRATKEGREILTIGDTDTMNAIDKVAANLGTSREALIDVLRRAPEDGTLKVIDLPKDRVSAILDYDAIQPFDMVGGHVVARRGDWLGDGPMFYLDKIEVLSKRKGAGTEAMMEMFQEATRRGKSTFYTSPLSPEGDLFWKGLAKKGLIEPVGFEKVAGGPLKGQNAPVWRIVDDVVMKQVDMESLPPGSFGDIFGNMFEQDSGLNQLWHVRGQPAMDALVDGADEAFGVKVTGMPGLSSEAQQQVQGFASAYKGQLSSDKWAMQKFGEFGRDSALLNYNMRLNVDAWVQNVMPYEFWTLHSMARWGMHSIDRPAAATLYLRMQRFLEEGFRPENGLPQRLKGSIRIKAPWLPKEWQGFIGNELFVNPLGGAVPFKQWGYAAEQIEKLFSSKTAMTERMLLRLLQDGTISDEIYQNALDAQGGEAWDQATFMVSQSDEEREVNALDTASTISSIHAPLLWAHYLARGEPERIGPLLPITRTIKGTSALLGISPNTGGWNIEGAVRGAVGLPKFDEWDDYRINRMLSNMVADGDITAQEAKIAITQRTGEAFREATRRAGIEYGISALGSVLGIPSKAYPPGEEHLRKLRDEYQFAWKQHEGGDEEAVNRFNEENPGYEVRQLALTFDPEKQLQKFLTDDLWDRWADLPIQHKREVADQLGTVFTEAFLSKETRSIENIDLDTMQYWAIVMGADKPGEFHWDQDKLPLELTPPEDAKQLQAYYVTRQANFRYREVVGPLLDVYFDLEPGSARKQYKSQNPIIQSYFDYRRDFMQRNPHLAPYIEDDPDRLPKFISAAEREEIFGAAPTFNWIEWTNVLGQVTSRLFIDSIARIGPMEATLAEELEFQAESLGMTTADLTEDLHTAYEEAIQQ